MLKMRTPCYPRQAVSCNPVAQKYELWFISRVVGSLHHVKWCYIYAV
jgi:hypothetical protein